jgi:hypothetical protein
VLQAPEFAEYKILIDRVKGGHVKHANFEQMISSAQQKQYKTPVSDRNHPLNKKILIPLQFLLRNGQLNQNQRYRLQQ